MKYSPLILFLLLLGLGHNSSTAQSIKLKVDTVSVSCASTDIVLVPVKVSDFNNVGSFQFTLQWDTSKLDYQYVASLNPLFTAGPNVFIGFDTTSFQQQNPAKLTFVWLKVGGLSVPSNTTVFSVAFKRIGGSFTPVSLVNTPVVIEATDPLGETLAISVTNGGVRPIDNQPPTITCPPGITDSVSSATAIPNIAPISVVDNCLASVGWTASGATSGSFPNDPDASGAVFNLGQTTVTYQVTDAGNNTATCSFLINLIPQINTDSLTFLVQTNQGACGSNVSINISALNFSSLGSVQFSVMWNPAVLSFTGIGNFNPNLMLTSNNFGISQAGSGLLSFVWTTNQLAGTSLPQASSLFSINFSAVGGAGATSPIKLVDMPSVREVYTLASGAPEEIGAVWINGLFTTTDNTGPVITCPANVSVVAPQGTITATVNNLQPISITDNCSGTAAYAYATSGATVRSGSGNANGVFNAGTTMVVYTATDAAGNTGTCSFKVTVDAGTPVTIFLDTLNTDCQATGSTVTFNVRVKDFTNLVGLQTALEWDETVLEFVSATNFFPGLGITAANFNNYANVANGQLQFFGTALPGIWPTIPNGGILFTLTFKVLNAQGATNIGFTGNSEAANPNLDPVPLELIPGFFKSQDLSAPLITCAADTLVTATVGSCTAMVTLNSPQVSDACSGIQGVTSMPASNLFQAGITAVTFTAKDNVGLTATCSMQVTVVAGSNPILSNCPSNISVDAPGNDCMAPIAWTLPTAIDACGAVAITPVPSQAPGNFMVGTTTVVYTATDPSGNTATCSFTVVVRDLVKPLISCPPNLELDVPADSCCAPGNFSLPVATDNCDASLTVIGNLAPTDKFCAGTSLITYMATDDFGNSATCSFTITVVDETQPAIVFCPSDIVVSTALNNCGATVNWDIPVFKDNCDGSSLTIINVYNPNTLFPVGETLVEYFASDETGNLGTCTFTITVIDQTIPVLSNCPQNQFFQLSGNKCDTLLNFANPLAIDNCPNIGLSSSPPFTQPFPIGMTVVTYTATDGSGNTGTCTFTVNVVEKVAPTFMNCPPDLMLTNVDPCNAVPAWTSFPSVVDNCTSAMITDSSAFRPGDAFPVGETEVVIKAVDLSGNIAFCEFKVTIIGIPPGFYNIPEDIMQVGCAQVATWDPLEVVGICDLDTVYSTHKPGDVFQPGVTVVTYTAVALSGSTVTATFTVNIIDNVNPVVDCPDGPVVVNVGGTVLTDPDGFISGTNAVPTCDGVEVSFTDPAATDNCGPALLAQTDGNLSGTFFAIGKDTVVFTATDGVGNKTLCSVVVEVTQIEPLNPFTTPNPICSEGFVEVTLTDVEDAVYVLEGVNQTDTILTNKFSVLIGQENGNYTLYALVNGCKSPEESLVLTLIENPVAVNDTLFAIPGQILEFDVLNNDAISFGDQGIVTYVPNPTEGLTQVQNGMFAFNGGTGTKTVTFFYKVCSTLCPDLCTDVMGTVFLAQKDEKCTFIPNVFTPNGDDSHDKFVIPCIDLIDTPASLVVYNQWGDKVYESDDYKNDWDGTLLGKGKLLPDATYYYILQPGGSLENQHGFIQIIR